MYFSGFCLKDEEVLFSNYREVGDFCISGFSFGAIKALQYTIKQLKNNKRVDKLQLFSPAFFIDKNIKYKRVQLMFFKKDEEEYKNNFIKNIAYPKNIDLSKYVSNGTYGQLDLLLNFKWEKEDLEYIISNGVKIEVYLGGNDKIIDSFKAKEYFKNFAEVYFIKKLGHIL